MTIVTDDVIDGIDARIVSIFLLIFISVSAVILLGFRLFCVVVIASFLVIILCCLFSVFCYLLSIVNWLVWLLFFVSIRCLCLVSLYSTISILYSSPASISFAHHLYSSLPYSSPCPPTDQSWTSAAHSPDPTTPACSKTRQ